MNSWFKETFCKHYLYTCQRTEGSRVTPEAIAPAPIPLDDRSNRMSGTFGWNETASIVVLGLLICVLVFLILNSCCKGRSSRAERGNNPGYGIPITLVEEGVVNFAAQPPTVENAS
ncbi:hypothetical protein DdX_17567 [Ditylenchus destructor]|uniref:Uncharacterized protein n=1 Tax=Ditylenchus destructor TaxID=166010 RepID=A0AAD4QVP4_9BILA|nr:hypothetical protein DdX_17567 [Ditylenchus destructor]